MPAKLMQQSLPLLTEERLLLNSCTKTVLSFGNGSSLKYAYTTEPNPSDYQHQHHPQHRVVHRVVALPKTQAMSLVHSGSTLHECSDQIANGSAYCTLQARRRRRRGRVIGFGVHCQEI